jgi:hypothetical protein
MKKLLLISIPLTCAFMVAGMIPFLTSKTIIHTPDVSSHIGPLVEEAIRDLKTPGPKEELIHADSAELWKNVVSAYEWLRIQNHKDRYVFLFNFAQANSVSDLRLRHVALQNWEREESLRIKESFYLPKIHEEWSAHVEKISTSLKNFIQLEVKSRRPQTQSLSDNKKIITSLQKIKSEIASYKGTTQNVEGMNTNLLLLLIICFGAIGSSLISTIAGKEEKPTAQVVDSNNHSNVTVVGLVPAEHNNSNFDFEAICQERIGHLKYMFNSAGISIHNLPKEPHPYRLSGNKENISNAVEALVRGSLSFVQNQKDYSNLSLQWSCKMTEERAYFDIDILGKRITEADLKTNHLLLEANSMVSQFGRAEKNLENYRPTIQIIPQENKTKISLSLETSASSLGASVH